MILIGIHGKLQSGKDTIADYLLNRRKIGSEEEFMRFAFADPLRTIVSYLFNVKTGRPEGHDYPPNVRKLLQDVGVKLREVDPDVWVNYLWRDIQKVTKQDDIISCLFPRCFVIPDVRFLNEVELIQRHGGHLWKVVRHVDRKEDMDEHSSETALDNFKFDRTFKNDWTIRALEIEVENELQRILELEKK